MKLSRPPKASWKVEGLGARRRQGAWGVSVGGYFKTSKGWMACEVVAPGVEVAWPPQSKLKHVNSRGARDFDFADG